MQLESNGKLNHYLQPVLLSSPNYYIFMKKHHSSNKEESMGFTSMFGCCTATPFFFFFFSPVSCTCHYNFCFYERARTFSVSSHWFSHVGPMRDSLCVDAKLQTKYQHVFYNIVEIAVLIESRYRCLAFK